jgi:diguanylate cyclase (GGDEF)-like protein
LHQEVSLKAYPERSEAVSLKEVAAKFESQGSVGEVELPPRVLELLQSCRTLPSVPGVVMEVLDLTQDPEIGTAEIAKVISRDPALVAKILKVANSPLYGVRREVTTLAQAVNMLGTNGAMSLALSFSLVHGLRKETEPAFDHQAYWRRSVISATATLAVGNAIQAGRRDELFLPGLLQDIGMLVLNEAMPAYGRMVVASDNDHELLTKVEREELGTDHASVSFWFLKKWGLPGRLISAILASHESKGVRNPLAKSVAVGGRIAEIWTNPKTIAAMTSAAEAARNLLGIPETRFDEILNKTAAQLPETTRNLEVSVGDESFIHGLLDQARQAMAEINVRALQEARQFAVQAQRDSLTSLYNRNYLDQVLGVHFNISRKMAQPLAAIFIDIDDFKRTNDTFGHRAGDSVLISVARVIQSAIRDSDTVVRYGGDEFVVVLNDTSEDIAGEVAERIRASVEKQQTKTDSGLRIPVTVSVGWATMSPKSSLASGEELLEIADRSLYVAKSSGRNRVARAG